MAALYCSCPQKYRICGELWWVGDKHEWVFYDGLATSETYAANITHCPACGRRLERTSLKAVGRLLDQA
jgi:hypothetical protein